MIHILSPGRFRAGLLAYATICSIGFQFAKAGHPETCVVTPSSSDCNGNDVADDCDIDSGLSVDCNGNEIPDECEIKRRCRPLGEYFTPEHIFSVQPYCAFCDPGGGHYGIDSIKEINPNNGRSRFFIQMPDPYCYILNDGAAISPDGKRLLVTVYNQVSELDPQAQWSSVAGATGSHVAFDKDGNFYVSKYSGNEKVLRSSEFVTFGGTTFCGGMAVVPLRYDVNDDGESNDADLAVMVSCLDGVNVGPPTPECYAADMDSDWDVDLYDVQSFIRWHTVHNR